MPTNKNPKYPVTILRRWDETRYIEVGRPTIMKGVTYVGAGLAPSTIWIPKAEYTDEREDKEIREDIETRLALKPQKKTV